MSTLRGDLPRHVAWLGYGGLLPFVGLLILTVVAGLCLLTNAWHGVGHV